MRKWIRRFFERNDMHNTVESAKNTVCMPAHLPEVVAMHIAKQAKDRGWSNSQYLRFLAMLDLKRVEDDAKITAEVHGIPREQFELSERSEREA